jgi:HEPN domain-containing protein
VESGHAPGPGSTAAGGQGAAQRDERGDYPKTHDPAPVFAQAIRARGIDIDASVLDSLTALSQELAQIRGPAFYQEIVVTDAQARDWVHRVEGALQFGEELLGRLRRVP